MKLDQVGGLYGLGFAIHLLHPRSKKPIALKWSKLPRAKWFELEKEFRREMNIGVRLGSPSEISGGFLAVIDCDVKGTEQRHQIEMLEAFESLVLPSVADAPRVLSGRGNGSQHVYVVTEEPARARRLSQSKEEVKVHMPSAKKPSANEVKKLTAKEIKAGTRLRPAWEISLMGDGQQVVLPPSIHPDSGKAYRWGKLPKDASSFPLYVPPAQSEKVSDRGTSLSGFKPVEVDLTFSDLSDDVIEKITSGEGVSDRSAALLGVANAMLKARMTETEILSVLTEPDHYLGQVAYDHAQTKDRGRAAEWVRRYTLEKSKAESLAAAQFDDEVEVEELLDERAAADQESRLVGEPEDWRHLLERSENEGKPKNTLKNVILILQHEGGSDVFKRDEFSHAELYGRSAPWGGVAGAEVVDIDTIRIKTWLAEKFRFEPSNDRINEAVMKIADINRYHPVRDYLDTLDWDGTPRIDTWLKDYLGAEAPDLYLRAISRKVLIAMIARIYRPGCKFEPVMVLEGVQGIGKSRSLKALAGDWFTDATIDIHDKDAVMAMRSKWLIEMGELSGVNKADTQSLKAFISRETDRIRVPYGKRSEDFPRQCVFIGSTNDREYLRDTTGNRRFWPVKVGDCDVEGVARDRDQLFAEAKFAYEIGETLYLDPAEEEIARAEQGLRAVYDGWEDLVLDWLAKEDADEVNPKVDRAKFRMDDLFDVANGPLGGWKMNAPESKRVSEILRKLGFTSQSLWDRDIGGTRRFWVNPSLLTPEKRAK